MSFSFILVYPFMSVFMISRSVGIFSVRRTTHIYAQSVACLCTLLGAWVMYRKKGIVLQSYHSQCGALTLAILTTQSVVSVCMLNMPNILKRILAPIYTIIDLGTHRMFLFSCTYVCLRCFVWCGMVCVYVCVCVCVCVCLMSSVWYTAGLRVSPKRLRYTHRVLSVAVLCGGFLTLTLSLYSNWFVGNVASNVYWYICIAAIPTQAALILRVYTWTSDGMGMGVALCTKVMKCKNTYCVTEDEEWWGWGW